VKQFIEHLTGRVVLMKNEHDQSWDFPRTHSIRLLAQESHKHETTKLLNFTVSSTRCPAPASANAPGHGSLRAPCSACSTLRLLLTSLQHRLPLAPSLYEAVRAPCTTLAPQLLRPAGLPCAVAWRQIKKASASPGSSLLLLRMC
jgi:hypothetical protein